MLFKKKKDILMTQVKYNVEKNTIIKSFLKMAINGKHSYSFFFGPIKKPTVI